MQLAALALALFADVAAAQTSPIVFVATQNDRPELLEAFRAELELRNERLVVEADADPRGRTVVFIATPSRIELRRPDGTVAFASLGQSVATVEPRVFALTAASLLEPLPPVASFALPVRVAPMQISAPARLATQRVVSAPRPRLHEAEEVARSPWSITPRIGASLRIPSGSVLPSAGVSGGYSFGVARIETGASVAASDAEYIVIVDPAGIALRLAGLDVGARTSIAIDRDGVALGGGVHIAWLLPVGNSVHLGPRADAQLAGRLHGDSQEPLQAQVSLALAVEVTP
jgi:hypothetical protein